eukprot:3586846-Rhodomonas_salina.2
MASHPFFHHHHAAPNVHVEHLPAGRLFAHPAANPDGVLDPRSLDGSEGHPGILHDFHHSSHSYHSVPPGLYSTELYSGAVCALFAALAVVQLVRSRSPSRPSVTSCFTLAFSRARFASS